MQPLTVAQAQSYGATIRDSSIHSRTDSTTETSTSDEIEHGHQSTRRRHILKTSLTLTNSGSVARDHLASERTFLAYVRTSLAIASMGIALIQLFRMSAYPNSIDLQRFARPLGATLIITGLITLTIGIYRFFKVQNALIAGKFPASRFAIALPALVLGSIITILFSVMFALRTGQL